MIAGPAGAVANAPHEGKIKTQESRWEARSKKNEKRGTRRTRRSQRLMWMGVDSTSSASDKAPAPWRQWPLCLLFELITNRRVGGLSASPAVVAVPVPIHTRRIESRRRLVRPVY